MAKVEKLVACAPKERKEVSFNDFDASRILSAVAHHRNSEPKDDDKFIIADLESGETVGFMLSEAMTVNGLVVNKKGEQAKVGEECSVSTKVMIARINKKLAIA
jgi:malate/lactate dehydrogenase